MFLGLSGTTAAVQGGTFGLGFTTLPVVFAHMGAFGNFIGAIWFFMLFLAAITSSISMYQPALAFFQEALGWARKQRDHADGRDLRHRLVPGHVLQQGRHLLERPSTTGSARS